MTDSWSPVDADPAHLAPATETAGGPVQITWFLVEWRCATNPLCEPRNDWWIRRLPVETCNCQLAIEVRWIGRSVRLGDRGRGHQGAREHGGRPS